MTLELADRSITRPKRVAEDVFVKVGKFHFPTNFAVVDFKADPRVPLILGRSFLRTGRALIDVYGEEITLRVNDESITFNLNQTMRYSSTYDDTSMIRIDVIDVACKDFVQDVLDFQYNPKSSNPTLVFDDLISEIIIAKNLKVDEREALINVLKSYKRAIAWKIFDIKGIDPRFCTHKILMEDNYKPAVQSQRRVNPKIHDVIKKEVVELFDADMIYPISDSPWVSPIHCVPKKGGMTVVDNENNELIPMTLVTGWRDFSKITRMTYLLEKETPFVFFKECNEAFNTLKKKLTEAPILVVPDWNLPFELMCDASDYVIGAVLRQCKSKHFQPIHYASKTMTKAQIHYTTTKKEMLAVVYAFEKFRPYHVLSKSISLSFEIFA
nr:hypothetical protein [Tanacetum cinerariifolium]